jgi:hypothetical protein
MAYCYLPPGDYDDGEFGGMKIGRGTEVLGENLPQRHFVHHKFHLSEPGSNPSRRGRKPATNRLSYGAALLWVYVKYQVYGQSSDDAG